MSTLNITSFVLNMKFTLESQISIVDCFYDFPPTKSFYFELAQAIVDLV